MEIKERVNEEINKQINAEFWSAYMYLSMSAYFESEGFPGFANWMRIQYQEELTHALKFFDYVNQRGGKVNLMPIAEVPTEWEKPVKAFEQAYNHERKVTDMINNLMDVAIEESDHATKSMLHWYLDEQVEEEDNISNILDQLKLIGDKGQGLLMLDKELGQRQFVDETQQQE